MQFIYSRCAELFIGWTDLSPSKTGHLEPSHDIRCGLGFPASSRVFDTQPTLFGLHQHCQSACPTSLVPIVATYILTFVYVVLSVHSDPANGGLILLSYFLITRLSFGSAMASLFHALLLQIPLCGFT